MTEESKGYILYLISLEFSLITKILKFSFTSVKQKPELIYMKKERKQNKNLLTILEGKKSQHYDKDHLDTSLCLLWHFNQY